MAHQLFSVAQIDREFSYLYPDLDLQVIENDNGKEVGMALDIGEDLSVFIEPTGRGFKASVEDAETGKVYRWDRATHATYAMRIALSRYVQQDNAVDVDAINEIVAYTRTRKDYESKSPFPTHKQRITLSLIERNLDVEFDGYSIDDAYDFIKQHIEESKRVS